MFEGLASADKDPRRSLHIDEVATPELGPNEALVAVMASAINFNTVWSSIFEPIPTFAFLKRYARENELNAQHDQPFHQLGSDAAGVVLRVGPGVSRWHPGDEVVVHCNVVPLESAEGHDDAMMDPNQKIWGFENNFGALGHIALVKANQLMPKPGHLTWEEAASMPLVNSTTYRMLVGRHEGQMRQGDVVLVWGAASGLGGHAVQYVLNGGGYPICIVSREDRAELCRQMGAEWVVNRKAEGYRFWRDDGTQDFAEFRRFGARIRELSGGEDPQIVYEHPGRDTMGASVFVCARGGKIVTCASTTGYEHVYDNRYLWMNLKSIVGSHFANYDEAWRANKLVQRGRIHPILSEVHPLEDVGLAASRVHRNEHLGKVGVLVLASREGLGVRDGEMRARHLDQITLYRRAADVGRKATMAV
jgi:crotonyl-CoA reductase